MSQQLDCKSTVERAFELASSGEVSSLERLIQLLGREGYATSMVQGPRLLKQLRERITAHRRITP